MAFLLTAPSFCLFTNFGLLFTWFSPHLSPLRDTEVGGKIGYVTNSSYPLPLFLLFCSFCLVAAMGRGRRNNIVSAGSATRLLVLFRLTTFVWCILKLHLFSPVFGLPLCGCTFLSAAAIFWLSLLLRIRILMVPKGDPCSGGLVGKINPLIYEKRDQSMSTKIVYDCFVKGTKTKQKQKLFKNETAQQDIC